MQSFVSTIFCETFYLGESPMLLRGVIAYPYDCHVVFHFMDYTTIYLSILLLTDICFQFGTVTKNAAMNILVHVFWCTLYPVLLGLCLEMELLTFNFHEHYWRVFMCLYQFTLHFCWQRVNVPVIILTNTLYSQIF